ncbi:MAG: hypothetical protein AB8G23_00955 [Myxococcota bacterium]
MRRGLRLVGAAGLLGALLLIPAQSVADSTPQPTARPLAELVNSGDDASAVSMSPGAQAQRPNTKSLTSLEGDQTARPLTRAAAQLRVDTMSPTDWLASFGHVTVGQIDTP